METRSVIQYWLATAANDLSAAEHLFKSGDYPHALFIGHLYLEKMIKAQIVRCRGEYVPQTENLNHLAEIAGLDLTLDQWGFLARVTEYSAKTRYPDVSMTFQRQCTREFCAVELTQIRNFGMWLKQVATA